MDEENTQKADIKIKDIEKKISAYHQCKVYSLHFTNGDNEYNLFFSICYKFIQIYIFEIFECCSESLYNEKAFDANEKAVLLVVNKIIFENLFSFFMLIDKKHISAALNCLRAYMEGTRLFYLLIQDDEFRKLYIKNENVEFRSKKDREFVQSEINKRLENVMKLELNNGNKLKLDFDFKSFNQALTKGSTFSKLHSEVSKMVHLTNVNLFMPYYYEHGKIFKPIGIEDFNFWCLSNIKKYTEFLLLEMFNFQSLLVKLSKSNTKMTFTVDEIFFMICKNFKISYNIDM